MTPTHCRILFWGIVGLQIASIDAQLTKPGAKALSFFLNANAFLLYLKLIRFGFRHRQQSTMLLVVTVSPINRFYEYKDPVLAAIWAFQNRYCEMGLFHKFNYEL